MLVFDVIIWIENNCTFSTFEIGFLFIADVMHFVTVDNTDITLTD